MSAGMFIVLVLVAAIAFFIALSLPQSILFALGAVVVVVGISSVPTRG